MKSLRNKVIMSAIVLVFAVIATIGSTYAWFTVSNQTTVTSMNVEVASSESLLMRAWQEGELEVEGQEYQDYAYGWTLADFTTNVDLLDSDAYDGTGSKELYTLWRMLPVTALVGESSFNTAYTDINLNSLRYLNGNPENPTQRLLASADANNSTGHYLEFKFWMLRPGDGDQNITMDYTLTTSGNAAYRNAIHIGVIGDKEQFTANDLTFDAAADTITTAGAVNFSNWNAGDTIVISNASNVLNDGTYTVESATATVITIVEDALTDDGAGTGSATFNGTNQELHGMNIDYAYSWQDFDAGWDDGPLDSVVNWSAGDNSINTALANIAGGTGADNDEICNHLEAANVPELVTVRVWIEGWDLQTTNAIMGSQFNLAITFNLVA